MNAPAPSRVNAKPSVFRGVASVELSVGRSRLYVPLDQLREVADQLHDNADIYEQAQRDGRAPIR